MAPDTPAATPAAGAPASRRPRRRIGRLPLRTKLIAIFTVAIIGVSLAIGAITQVLLTRYLTDQLDRQVTATSMRLTGPPPGDITPPGTPGSAHGAADIDDWDDWADDAGDDPLCSTTAYLNGPGGRQPDDSVFAVFSKSGGTSHLSAALRGTYPSCTLLTAERAAALTTVPTDGSITTVPLGEFGDYRVTARAYEGTTFVSGLSTASIDATRRQLVTILAIVTGSAVLIGGLAVWWSVRRSLSALEQVAATAKQATTLPLHRGAVELAVRVPSHLTDPRTEAGTVGAALNQLLAHVEDALTAREESEGKVRRFVADASHELRTPLTAIRGYAELAGRHPEDIDGVRHALARVEAESTRMSALVEDLLLLARLDAGRPLVVGPVDLTSLAVDAVADVRVAAPDHRWVVNVPGDPVFAMGDSSRLHQVLANLLANARVHTPAGTTVVVDVADVGSGGGSSGGALADAPPDRRPAGNAVTLRVSDDGPGIPAEMRQAVFGRFVRGDTSRTRGSGSTGLGLAIVTSLVQAHGGSISLESAPGRTVFTVLLPPAAERDGAPGATRLESHSHGTGNER